MSTEHRKAAYSDRLVGWGSAAVLRLGWLVREPAAEQADTAQLQETMALVVTFAIVAMARLATEAWVHIPLPLVAGDLVASTASFAGLVLATKQTTRFTAGIAVLNVAISAAALVEVAFAGTLPRPMFVSFATWFAAILAMVPAFAGWWPLRPRRAALRTAATLQAPERPPVEGEPDPSPSDRNQLFARRDPASRLPNRRSFDEALIAEVRRAKREHLPLAVLLVGLDGFARLNSCLGRAAAARYVREIGLMLRDASARPGDLSARFRGDTFALLLPGTDAQGAQVVAERVRAALREKALQHPLSETGTLTACVGIAAVPPGELESPEAITCLSEDALARAKELGPDRVSLLGTAGRVLGSAGLTERDLRLAIERGEFFLLYQPQVDLQSGLPTGFEALLRWRHPLYGSLPASEFVQLAERCGLLGDIEVWTLREACDEASYWPGTARLAINISAARLADQRLLPLVRRALDETGLPASRLELEVLESALAQPGEQSLAVLAALRADGIGVALDSFGSGGSSLTRLGKLPVTSIKLDRSFVEGGEFLRSTDILRSLVDLSRKLDLRIIVEGVETEEQLIWLREEGVTTVQGYFIGRPCPGADVSAMLSLERV